MHFEPLLCRVVGYTAPECIKDIPEDHTKMTLLFQNRTTMDIILRSHLEELAQRSEGRLQVAFFVSQGGVEPADGGANNLYVNSARRAWHSTLVLHHITSHHSCIVAATTDTMGTSTARQWSGTQLTLRLLSCAALLASWVACKSCAPTLASNECAGCRRSACWKTAFNPKDLCLCSWRPRVLFLQRLQRRPCRAKAVKYGNATTSAASSSTSTSTSTSATTTCGTCHGTNT